MAGQIIAPKINAQLKNKILQNQDNQCARRPYARLEEPFKNHMCHLWKKNGRTQGKFSNGEYTIVKIDNDARNTEDNLIALCDDCYTVFKNRTTRQISRYNESESDPEFDSEEDVCDAFDNLHVRDLYDNRSQHVTNVYINNYYHYENKN
jgi:hypothetical protein